MPDLIVTTRDELSAIVRAEVQAAILAVAGPDEAMKCTQAARFLNTSVWTMRRLCKAGKVRARKDGRDWLVLRSELERYARG